MGCATRGCVAKTYERINSVSTKNCRKRYIF
jgi:hypothetical protein